MFKKCCHIYSYEWLLEWSAMYSLCGTIDVTPEIKTNQTYLKTMIYCDI